MFYRFQKSQTPETSVHTYPSREIVHLYKKPEFVEVIIKKVGEGDLMWGEYDDPDDFFLKENYVCCHQDSFLYEDDLVQEMEWEGSFVAAHDEYVVVFHSDEEYELHDGYIAKCDEIRAVYKKMSGNTYTRIK